MVDFELVMVVVPFQVLVIFNLSFYLFGIESLLRLALNFLLPFFHIQEGALDGVEIPSIMQIFHVTGISIKVEAVIWLEWEFQMNTTLIIHILTFMGDNLLHEVI